MVSVSQKKKDSEGGFCCCCSALMSHFQRGAGADACFLKRLRGLRVAPQAACPAHTLPSEAQCPRGLSTLCPQSPAIPAAPTPSNRDQFLKTEHYYPRGRRVPPSAHTGQAHSLRTASVPAGKPHIPTLTQRGRGHPTCVGSPPGLGQQSCSFPPRVHPAASWAGSRARSHPHSSGKAGFPCAPGKQRGGEGKMEPFPW